MKNLSGIIMLMLLASNISFASEIEKKANPNKKKIDTVHVVAKIPFIPNTSIHTPIIFDDRIDTEQYCGYTIYDSKSTEVLKHRPSVVDPIKLRLKAGDYFVKLDGQKSPVYQISVLENQYNEFVIE